MIKLEIIVNQAMEEDIIETLTANGFGENFTYIAPVFGRGRHGRREGSAVWPEENVIFIVYVTKEELEAFIPGLKRIKTAFSEEGFRCYISEGSERII